jgi:plasmid stabilization system protein ParE
MNVRWTDVAIGHLESIHDDITRNSPKFARRVLDRIIQRSEQIAADLI